MGRSAPKGIGHAASQPGSGRFTDQTFPAGALLAVLDLTARQQCACDQHTAPSKLNPRQRPAYQRVNQQCGELLR